jgi:hypothetical protein
LLAPGNEAEWAKINEEEERQEAEFARLSISERLEFGQKLCDQAFKLYNAVHASGQGHRRDPPGSDLSGVIVDANISELENVVIGDLAVIVHGYLCTARDSKLLVADNSDTDEAILRFFERIGATRFNDGKVLTADDVAGAHHLRVDSRHGVIDIMRGGLPPLDYETAAARAVEGSWRGSPFRVAALPTLVGFKRLANRGQDRVDLEKLEQVNGELPIEPIPGLDDA